MKFRDRAAVLLATGLSVGNIPFAPGTWGSLLGLPLCLVLAQFEAGVIVFGLIAVILGAVWVAGRAEQVLAVKDAPCIVIDEVAGIMVGLAGIPATPVNFLCGFAIFRLMDVFKPFPVRRIENGLPGGWGVVLDDVAAGVYCNLLVRGLDLLWGAA